jgi:hypothetical protein
MRAYLCLSLLGELHRGDRESRVEDDEDEIELLELGEELVEKLEQIPRQ